MIASNYSIKENEIVIEKQRKKINSLLLCSETSIDDLIGCFQSKTYKKNEKGDTQKIDITSLISWVDGPIIKETKNGNPIILDNINYSKPQVIESLNPLIEENYVVNDNSEYKLIEKKIKE